MFARSKILGVNSDGRLNIQPSTHFSGAAKASKKTEVSASMLSQDMLSNGSALNRSVNAFWQSSYQYMMTGIIPASPDLTDSQSLALFFRDMYLYDSVAGSAVDIQSSFPFSDWELRGLDADDLKIYNDALERLSLQSLMPQISTSYLVDGFFAGSLVFDADAKQFMDILIHDALCCEIIPSPFHNIDPKITVHTSGGTQAFLQNASEYTKMYLQTMPAQFLDLLQSGMFELDPVATLYLARHTLNDRAYTSYLQRLLPCYLIEKVLFRGTLVEAQRRQRATTHIQAGDDTWIPTDDELHDLVQLFQSTESDPLGAWIATRNNIQISDFRQAGEIWKWYETSDSLTAMKLRCLGISDAFLSGDSNYASSESAYSTFVETVNAYRTHLTNSIFYKKIFPLIAVVHDLYVDGKERPVGNNLAQFLFNASNRQALRMPKLHWHKQLEARDEQSQFEMLENLSERGIPVPLTTWVAAAGMDIDALVNDLKESQELQKRLEPYLPKTNENDDDEDGGGYSFASTAKNPKFDECNIPIGRAKDDPLNWTTASMKAQWARLNHRPLLARKFSEEDNAEWEVMPSGKRHLKVHQEAARRDRLYNLAKIMTRYEKDPNYRKKIVDDNTRRGVRTLKGF